MFGFIPYKNIQRSAEALPRKEKPVISMITGFSHLWQMTLILIKDAPLGENCTPYGSFAPPKLQVILS